MKNVKGVMAMLLSVCACALFGQDQNVTGSSQESIVENLLKRGESGSASWTLSDDGGLKSLFIVGVAPLNKALPSAYAKKMAATQSRLDAENSLSKTLNSNFNAKQSSSGEMMVTIKGEAAGDEQGSGSTQSSMTNLVSEEMQSVTKSAQAGLMQLAVDPNRDGTYVAVFVWNRNITKQLQEVSKISAETAKQSLGDYKDAKEVFDASEENLEKSPEAPQEAAKEPQAPRQKTGKFESVKGNPKQKILLPEGL